MPFDAWLKGPLSAVLSNAVSETSVRKRGWFNPVEVHKIQENFKSGIVGWAHPWLLMMTELWAREVLGKSNE